MPGATGEAHHLILDGGAVARPHAADLARIHGRAGQVGADDGVRCLGRGRDPAFDLRIGDPAGQERERHRRSSSPGCISSDAQSIERPSSRAGVPVLSRPRRRSRAKSRSDKPLAGGSPCRPAGVFSSPRWISPRRKVPVVRTTAPARMRRPSAVTTPATLAVVEDQVLDRRLDHLQVGRRPDRRLHGGPVELAVGLGTGALHRRTLGAVEQAELDAGRVGDPPHQPVQRIDLAHQVPLAEPADGRIAGHLADGGEPVRDERRARAHARRRSRRLAARMAAADNDDVEGFGVHCILREDHTISRRNLAETMQMRKRRAAIRRQPP